MLVMKVKLFHYFYRQSFYSKTLNTPGIFMSQSEDATLNNQKAIIENQEALLKNQATIIHNQEALLKNQTSITGNQEVIVHNQASIVDNQKHIVDNQVALNTISKTQAYMLNLIRKISGTTETQEETEKFLEVLKSKAATDATTDLVEPASI